MARDRDFNIFDPFSGNKQISSPKKTVANTPISKQILTPQAVEKKEHRLNDQEMIEMVKRIQFLQKDLEAQLSNIKAIIPFAQLSISKFLNNKENFSPEQWIIIQENRQELQRKLGFMLGSDPKKIEEKHQTDKGNKEFRGKTLGSRRKWIPIR